MKRLILCIAILAVIITGSVLSLLLINNKNQQLIETLDAITVYAEDRKTDQALEKIEEFSRLWKKYYVCVSFLVESSCLEDITIMNSRIFTVFSDNSS